MTTDALVTAIQRRLTDISEQQLSGGGLISSGPTPPTSTGKLPAMSIASSRGRNRAIFRSRRRPSTTW